MVLWAVMNSNRRNRGARNAGLLSSSSFGQQLAEAPRKTGWTLEASETPRPSQAVPSAELER
jgi:hypothetical protein